MPRPKPNMQILLKEYFISKNIEIINIPNENDFNCNSLIEIKCKIDNNHTYKMSITQIRRKTHNPTLCPHCEKNKSYEEMGIPIQKIQNYCDLYNYDFFPKKIYYNRWEDSITLICKIDNNKIELKSLGYWEKTQQPVICKECELKKLGLLNEYEYNKKLENIKHNIYNIIDFPISIFNKEITTKCLETIQKNNWHIIEYNGTHIKSKFICIKCGHKTETLVNNLNKCLGCSKIRNKQNVCEKLKEICKENNIYIPDRPYYYETRNDPIDFKCNSCGHEFNFNWSQITGKYYKIACPNCYKSTKRIKENEVYEFIKEIYSGIILQNDRTIIPPKELDIFIPEKNIAIEFCGNIWHSEKYLNDKFYHKNKLNLCNDKNIKLLTIFEDEWDEKKDICKSRIKNILGITKTVVFARKCIIKDVDKQTCNKFYDENHIQGKCIQTDFSYGLYYNDTLISIMSFNETIKSRKSDYELNRFCNLLDYSIPGAFSKLLSHFKNTHKNKVLTSYSDNRWGNGDVYQKNGFILKSEIPIRYFYVGNYTLWKRKHRFTFNKYRLNKLFKDSVGSEKTITEKNELYRIWDCGYKKWEIIC
jgi:hypothetical protein